MQLRKDAQKLAWDEERAMWHCLRLKCMQLCSECRKCTLTDVSASNTQITFRNFSMACLCMLYVCMEEVGAFSSFTVPNNLSTIHYFQQLVNSFHTFTFHSLVDFVHCFSFCILLRFTSIGKTKSKQKINNFN